MGKRYAYRIRGKKKSFNYKNNIRYQNLRVAIINQIKGPPDEFRDFIYEHFNAKKNEIIDTITKWRDESKKLKSDYYLAYDDLIKEFKSLI